MGAHFARGYSEAGAPYRATYLKKMVFSEKPSPRIQYLVCPAHRPRTRRIINLKIWIHIEYLLDQLGATHIWQHYIRNQKINDLALFTYF